MFCTPQTMDVQLLLWLVKFTLQQNYTAGYFFEIETFFRYQTSRVYSKDLYQRVGVFTQKFYFFGRPPVDAGQKPRCFAARTSSHHRPQNALPWLKLCSYYCIASAKPSTTASQIINFLSDYCLENYKTPLILKFM